MIKSASCDVNILCKLCPHCIQVNIVKNPASFIFDALNSPLYRLHVFEHEPVSFWLFREQVNLVAIFPLFTLSRFIIIFLNFYDTDVSPPLSQNELWIVRSWSQSHLLDFLHDFRVSHHMLRGYRDGSRNFFCCIVVYIQWLPRVLLIFECLSFGLKEFTANFRLFNFNIVLAHRCLIILQQDFLRFVFTLCIPNDDFFYPKFFVDSLIANRVYRHILCLITELFS